MSKFFPKLHVDALCDINIDEMKKAGITAFLCDIDNTMAITKAEFPSDEVVEWVREAQEKGFKVCLVSNNNKKRVSKFAEPLGVPYVYRAMKPLVGGYIKAIKILNIEPSKACMVGDQIFTDIWGANRVGMYSVLVNRLSQKESFLSLWKRPFEKMVMKKWKN